MTIQLPVHCLIDALLMTHIIDALQIASGRGVIPPVGVR